MKREILLTSSNAITGQKKERMDDRGNSRYDEKVTENNAKERKRVFNTKHKK